MYKITKEFHFSASHQLCEMPEDHPCARLHGHNYIVEIELSSASLNAFGFVVDFTELKPLKGFIDEELDHRHLNDVFKHDQVTSEFLSKFIFEFCKEHWSETSAVRVSETQKTWAEYRP
ncbi:6-carboxy-5,6,7,8-tetrahydropterin synthase [Pseudovibrio axinellae]|uniref:6-carboxy-5,6,7,8-tetrahydropterin synthase n=1 Tax=Pseudovibrio axinellae TaxID=989403 RepID=A0A165UN81_9HYPH|nr:6-carboxytetrahydropterin synthase QueD [Pseudovibrio axinellae]KZL12596.1 6-carboxy-5,6,7,8-tetrahydropterin synthase [Pseudovibrio axinellae]SEP65189.1 preQ(0) biosynthesis protein QueD [Pseudovibrio axinellae]